MTSGDPVDTPLLGLCVMVITEPYGARKMVIFVNGSGGREGAGIFLQIRENLCLISLKGQ